MRNQNQGATSHPANAGGKTPRGEQPANRVPGTGAEEMTDFNDVLSSVLSPNVLRKIFHLALKKRDMLRNLGGRKRKEPKTMDSEDEALNSILPMGVEYLKKPTMGGSGV